VQKQKATWRHLALLIFILLLFAASPGMLAVRHGILILNLVAAAVLVAAL
jgi:hypothetical protein